MSLLSQEWRRSCLLSVASLLVVFLISSSFSEAFRPSDFINCKQSDFCDVLRSLAKESENEFSRKHTARIKSARVINTRDVKETAFLDVNVFGEESNGDIEAGLQYFGPGIHRALLKRKNKEQYHVQDVVLDRAVPKPATLRVNSPFLRYGSSGGCFSLPSLSILFHQTQPIWHTPCSFACE
jgi:hypothetical protein